MALHSFKGLKLTAANYITWVFSSVSILFVILTFARNGNKDKVSEYKEIDSNFKGITEKIIVVGVKLDQVYSTINDMRSELKNVNSKIQEHDKEIVLIKKELVEISKQVDELRDDLK